jgi:hypothetical protein
MWTHIGTPHCGGLSAPTDYKNSPTSGSKIQNAVITNHSSQHRMNGPLSSMSRKFWCISNIWCGCCRRDIQLLCITLSQSMMTDSILWMALCELWLRRRLNGRKTCSLSWSGRNRSYPNIVLQWLQQQVCVSFQQISLSISGSCDSLGDNTVVWIIILRTKHPILYNTWRRFWIIWRMNAFPNGNVSLYGGICTRSRVCAGVSECVSIVSYKDTCRINIRSIDD